MRRLATTAPVKELIDKRDDYVSHYHKHYTSDDVVWRGLVRIAEVVVADPNFPIRRIQSKWLVQIMDRDPLRELRYGAVLEALRDIAATPRQDDAAAGGLRKPSGDAVLDDMRRLAIEAPIEELVSKRHDFIDLYQRSYETDRIVRHGIGRIAKETLRNDSVPERAIFARWLAQLIEKSPDFAPAIKALAQPLREIQ
ncbi:MAG: hypothetical protein AB8H80_18460 [Planctomycetota bacterium]